ncbi:Alpha/Beta hydrolase protein [Gloeopeniophorella convolvens]|nr:Alpha/Beta hydrolase protein [Gloeopeniophorella convolvens]
MCMRLRRPTFLHYTHPDDERQAIDKVSIPHPDEPGVSLVGILEQLEPNERPKILHGGLGHKDYLFQKRLAGRLPLDNFRFDFRGLHESGGTWGYAGFANEVQDLRAVVAYLARTYGYVVDLVIGHSRGSIVAIHWLCTSAEGRQVGAFVNVSGYYRMEVLYLRSDRLTQLSPFYSKRETELIKNGYMDWHVVVAGKAMVIPVNWDVVHEWSRWDTSIVQTQFPARTDVLTIHGMLDKDAPPYDAIIHAHIFSKRSPGTHNLHLIEKAGHHFKEHKDEVVETILAWWNKHERGELKTGIWPIRLASKL